MKITQIQITGLAGGTVEGGWADELKPEDDVHTIVEVLTDEGLTGVGSAFTSKALVEDADAPAISNPATVLPITHGPHPAFLSTALFCREMPILLAL